MKLFGSSGIRRIVDKSIFELALKAGIAVGKSYDKVVVGCDTRTSSEALKHTFISGLLGAGADCADAGLVPTPTLALAARKFRAGVVITASHNPPEYNGIKLLNPDGSAFDAGQREQTEESMLSNSLSTAPWKEIKGRRVYDGAVEEHIKHLQSHFPGKFKLKVVVDCGCGAASVITPDLLKRMGCEVIPLNCHPSGFFPHDIEPIEANLGDLMQATRESGADLGIAHDGDADRMMAVDDKGRFITGDKLLAIFARQAKAKKVVTTVDASLVVEELGFSVVRTRVGDIYVSEELKKGGEFGGEPSGAWVFPQSSFCPDGIFAAAQMVVIASTNKLSALVDAIPQYPLLRGSVPSQGFKLVGLADRLAAMKPLKISNIDGIKLDFKDGWLLIRVSGTEPKVRVSAEAKTEARVRQLYDSGIKRVQECLKGEEV